MKHAFPVTAVQFGATLYAPEENRKRIESAVRAAPAALVVLPELAVSGYGNDPHRLRTVAEPFDGPTRAMLQQLSDELETVIACGFCELAGGQMFNSAMMTAPRREPVLYRKLHLFDGEKEIFAPGDLGLVLGETDLGTIGICVCYDLRFVEVARGLALSGADLLAVPTAWVGGFDKTSRDNGGFIGQARGAVVQANLNQLPMVCASQSGGEQGIRFLGSSLIVDAAGNCLEGPLGEDEDRSITAELTRDGILAARVRGPRIRPRQDRRTDVYGIAITGVATL